MTPGATIMRSSTLLLAAALLLGCAGCQIIPMNADSSAALREAQVVQVVRYHSAPINITNPKDAPGLGPLSVVVVGSVAGSGELPTGDALARVFKLPDPGDEVARRLVEKLKAEGRLGNLRLEPNPLPRPLPEDASQYRARYPSGLVLELSIDTQGASYAPTNWRTYTYYMAGRARLIRVSDGKVLWLDTCNIHAFAEDAAKRQLDVSEFEANNGAKLKEITSYSNERCSRILADKILAKAS